MDGKISQLPDPEEKEFITEEINQGVAPYSEYVQYTCKRGKLGCVTCSLAARGSYIQDKLPPALMTLLAE